jgi:hypothetical protein
MKGIGVTAEQQSLLGSHNYSLRPLTTAGHLNYWQACRFAWLPFCISTFSLLCLTCSPRLTNEVILYIIYWVALVLLVAIPAVSFALIAFGIIMTKIYSTVNWPAALYWIWWPFWKLSMSIFAAVAAACIANTLWFSYFLPHQQMLRLQAYNNVNPSIASGERLQDAGIMTFNASANVDRARTGCLKNDVTYCVAPIIMGSDFDRATGGNHDLFMAGTDCCSCPGEFRCDAWNMPMAALGGLRIADSLETPFFRLASEDWASTYGVSTKRPIFFKWVSNPLSTWHELRETGVRFLVLAILGAPFIFVSISFALNAILQMLHSSGYADYIHGAAVDSPGIGKAMMNRYMDHQRKQTQEEIL